MRVRTGWITLALSACALVVGVGSSAASPILTNGGFDTGDLTGWSTSGLGSPTGICPNDPRDWNVSNSGSTTGCLAVDNPLAGGFAAYVMNDSNGPTTYRLFQDVVLPSIVTSASLSFFTSVQSAYAGAPRTLSVNLYNSSSALIGTPYTTNIPFTATTFGWTLTSLNLTSLLTPFGGQTVRLEFANAISETWTGPAGLGLDSVNLDVNADVVPEPGSMVLLGTGLAALVLHRRRVRRS
jgi:hypothetical protein